MAKKKQVLPSVKVIDIGVEVEDDWYGPVFVFTLTPGEGLPQLWSKSLKDHVARQILKDPMYLRYLEDPGYVKIMEGTEFEAKPELPKATSPKEFSRWMRERHPGEEYYVSVLKQYYEWDKWGTAYPRQG